MGSGALVFKKDEFSSIFGGDEELVREVLSGFITHCDGLTAAMAEEARRGDLDALIFSAHKLKGSSANVRAPLLSEAAAGYEKILKDDSPGGLTAGLVDVIDNYLAFRREVLALYPGLAAGLSAAASKSNNEGGKDG